MKGFLENVGLGFQNCSSLAISPGMDFQWLNHIRDISSKKSDTLFWMFLLGFTLFHLLILLISPVDLVSDEALYWEYSKHLDWSYYAKGPGIAIATWLSSHIFGDTVFGVRVGALFCFTVFSSAVYFFLKKLFSPGTALFGFLLTRLTLMFGVTGFVMTTDPLVLPFWLFSLWFAYRAIQEDKPGYWIPSFFLAGVGILVKFTAVLLLGGYGLVLLASKTRRHHLWSKSFWLASLGFLIAILPIFIWNAQHDWVNIGHNVGHTVGKGGGIPFKRLPEFIAGQLGLVGPIVLPLMLIALWRAGKRWLKEKDDIAGLLVMSTLPVLAVCVKVTATRSCYANWPMPAYVAGMLLLCAEFQSARDIRWYRKGLLLNGFAFALAQVSWFLPVLLPQSINLPIPIKRMVGWQELGDAVEAKAKEIARGENSVFVMANDYMTASSLRFELPDSLPVRLGSFTGRRLSEQDFWQTWEELKGKNAVVVVSFNATDGPQEGLGWFASCADTELPGLPPESRQPKKYRFYICNNFSGKGPNISQAY